MLWFLKLPITATLVSLGQGERKHVLAVDMHQARLAQLSWFPAKAGQLEPRLVAVYFGFC
jgi:hypothetical protein